MLLGTNAMGRGKFEFVNKRYVEHMDEALTQTNAETAGYPHAVRMPEVLENDRELFHVGLANSRLQKYAAVAVSTMWFENIWLADAFWRMAQRLKNIDILGESRPLTFDGQGNLDLPDINTL